MDCPFKYKSMYKRAVCASLPVSGDSIIQYFVIQDEDEDEDEDEGKIWILCRKKNTAFTVDFTVCS